MSTDNKSVTLSIDGEVVFTGEFSVAKILQAFSASTTPPASSVSHHKSFPINVDQGKHLIRKVDKKSADFLRTIAHNEGEITFKSMCAIFGIERWAEYSGTYGKGITRALRHMTDNSSASLIWWNDDEWENDNDPNGSVYIDGQALKSLQAAFGL